MDDKVLEIFSLIVKNKCTIEQALDQVAKSQQEQDDLTKSLLNIAEDILYVLS